MQILFLDFDGVLNSKQHFLALKEKKWKGRPTQELFTMKRDTNANNMWCLKYILENVPDLKIVISSAWRTVYDLELFKELFEIYGLDGECIIDKTPKRFSSQRVHEIREWLADHKQVEKWIAIDDHVVFNLDDEEKKNELLTDSWVGLTMHDAFEAIKHFKPDWKEPEILI